MSRFVSVGFFATFGLALVLALSSRLVVAIAAPSPSATPPPEIYRTLSRPMCTELNHHILPAIAMMLQNDRDVAKSRPIFKSYLETAFKNGRGAGDTTDWSSPGRAMALERMEMLVTPLAQNTIAIQKLLENSSLAHPSGVPEDDAKLSAVRDAMLKVLGAQSASLDLINGFVTTQQLGDMQHAGEENLSAIQGSDFSSKTAQSMETPSPNPFQADQIGLRDPNPYNIDPTQVPGLQVGWNQVSMIVQGLTWVQDETARRENAVSSATRAIATACGALH
ncbi:MAG: hypothetical protein JO311_07810 [Candidatus Eremiobacteraeota bacterium]|nr:hypothetical protein [Candidatus Eremiobacteraeota bacterium]MBV9264163.1 hypothetical protein [Candidatus Eremiobacteraeota bacterium]